MYNSKVVQLHLMCQELTIKVSLLEKRMQEKCIHLQGSEKNSNF